ncbi:MAG: hypothetical protein WC792_04680 [Candidatus Micrarchaeia archaeon]|jgi:hypothetical protein
MASERRGAKQYRPTIIGVVHSDENLAETKSLIDEAHAKGAKSIGLELCPWQLTLHRRKGYSRKNFFVKIAAYAKLKQMKVEPLCSDRLIKAMHKLNLVSPPNAAINRVLNFYEALAKPKPEGETPYNIKNDLAQVHAMFNLHDRYMARQALRRKPDVIVVGDYHAAGLEEQTGVKRATAAKDEALTGITSSEKNAGFRSLGVFAQEARRMLKRQAWEEKKAGATPVQKPL